MFSPGIDSENGVSIFDISVFWKGVDFVWPVNGIQIHRNRVRKSRRRQEHQELTSKMCWHNMESELGYRQLFVTDDQTRYMFRCSSNCSPGWWRCGDETKQVIWSSISLTFLWSHTRSCVNMWHENDTGSLETTSFFMDVLHSSHHYVWKYVVTLSRPRNLLICRM